MGWEECAVWWVGEIEGRCVDDVPKEFAPVYCNCWRLFVWIVWSSLHLPNITLIIISFSRSLALLHIAFFLSNTITLLCSKHSAFPPLFSFFLARSIWDEVILLYVCICYFSLLCAHTAHVCAHTHETDYCAPLWISSFYAVFQVRLSSFSYLLAFSAFSICSEIKELLYLLTRGCRQHSRRHCNSTTVSSLSSHECLCLHIHICMATFLWSGFNRFLNSFSLLLLTIPFRFSASLSNKVTYVHWDSTHTFLYLKWICRKGML